MGICYLGRIVGSDLTGQPTDMLLLHWSVEDPAHSDFLLLRNMLVRTHMQDLKEVTQETHYENYRAECIHKMTQMVVQDRKRR